MKALEEIKVSVYENVYSKKPKVMSFFEVIIMCIHPVYASIINAIRRYYAEGDHAAAQKLKSQLPCFTPAGTFDGAHAIKNFLLPSHIVGLDYDHVKDRLQVIQRCAADPHTVAAIESPTDGVKVFAYVEGIENRHREGQQLVSRYYNQLLGLESDPACKDESRLCYFSYSPNGYVAGLYQAFVLEPHLKEETNASSENKVLPPFPLQDNTPENVSEAEIAQFISSYIFLHPLTAGQRHSNVFKLACEASRRHYPQESILRELTAFFEHTDFRPEELTSVLSSGYKQVNEHAPASSTATSSSFQKDIRTKIPYGTLENSDSTEEAYWLGEEFRKGTPLFPRDLYNNLPDLLNDCIIEDASDREQDISLLSDLTALSAALPQTFGIYNHKKYSPHLFSVIFSSAGSGKSIAQTGRYLLEEIQTEILSTSESMLKNYHTAHNTWLSSGYKQVNEHAPASSTATSSSFQKDIRTKIPYGTLENSDSTEEAYWLGEEFRKGTPLFPRDLYNNLPDLLNDCIIEDASDREQDISLLSDLTALSAALPQTFGIYNHKKYSPHLFSVIFSSAGSGKSIAQTGRYLLEEIQTEILSTSESMLKNYHTAHNTWQAECQRKRKKGETCSEEPQRPPFKMLFIPATTSYTRMQIQMQDNGSQGSIIFDTEAQTLSTANHLDCGNFDDMLRKAFEHENIDSSYKANGIIPIYIRYPKLALLLTGTPGQIDCLLNSYGNGLPSRILAYTFREAPHWKEMGDDCISLEDSFKPIAHRVYELYNFCLVHPVLFHFTRPQWNRLNEIFSRMLSEVAMEGNDDLQAVVKRYAFLVMRISMIQTRIRQFEATDLSSEIYCIDADFERSLQIVLCCYEHSRLLHSSMPAPAVRPLKNPDIIRNFVNELPDSFTTDEAIQIGAKYDFNLRKVTRLLKSLNGIKISKVSHGSYTKMNK